MTFGEIWISGQRVMREFDAGTLTTIQEIVQQLYFTMCRQIALPALQRSIEMDFTSATNDGLPMPSDMAGIRAVIDESGHCRRIYYRTDETLKRVDDGRSHYYFRNIESPILAQGNIDIDQGGETFTGDPSMTADFTGEYIRFGTEPGVFLLSGPGAITTPYNGPKITNKLSIIGLPDTKRLCIVNPYGQRDDGKVMVYYWVLPAPLYLDSDSILMSDNGRALQLKLWIDLIGPMEKRKTEADQYKDELYGSDGSGGAWNELVASCQQAIEPAIPTDRRGHTMYFGRRRINPRMNRTMSGDR